MFRCREGHLQGAYHVCIKHRCGRVIAVDAGKLEERHNIGYYKFTYVNKNNPPSSVFYTD